MTIILTMAP